MPKTFGFVLRPTTNTNDSKARCSYIYKFIAKLYGNWGKQNINRAPRGPNTERKFRAIHEVSSLALTVTVPDVDDGGASLGGLPLLHLRQEE